MVLKIEHRQHQNSCPSGGHFYACANGFRGCCLVDPCMPSSGCPSEKDRTPSTASDEFTVTSTDVTDGYTPTTTPSQSLTEEETLLSISSGHTVFVTVTNTASTTTRETPSILAETGGPNGSNSSPVGAIAGGVIGGLFIIAATLFILILARRKKRSKEHRESTLPPPYHGRDMSEHLACATITSGSETKCPVGDDARDERAAIAPTPDPVPHLDSTMVMPPTEISGDPLGNIPELSAERNSNPFLNAHLPNESRPPNRSTQPRHSKTNRKGCATSDEAQDHVMSWANYNQRGHWNAASRLTSPHRVPDTSVAVWENMSPSRRCEDR